MTQMKGTKGMREPPAGHVSVPEAAQLLKVHPDSIRNWLKDKPQKIAGRVVTNTQTNRTEYWVLVHGDSDAPTLEEKLAERSQVATRGDLATSEENVLSLIERNLRVAAPKLDELGSKIDRQREELRGGQLEIYEVVSKLAGALGRIADAEERELQELSTLNRWLEQLHSGAQKDRDDASKDRDAMRLILQELVRQGRVPEVEPKPWWKRILGLD